MSHAPVLISVTIAVCEQRGFGVEGGGEYYRNPMEFPAVAAGTMGMMETLMPANKSAKTHARAKLKDLGEKLDGAKKAASADGAGALAQADLKLLEQEVVAEKLKAKRPASPTEHPSSLDGKLDKALKDSFPGSDPVSFVEAAPIRDEDRSLPTVPDKEPNEKT